MSGDTIFALSSGQGRAGVAVFRLSGSLAGSCLDELTGKGPPPPRRATLAILRFADGSVLDQGLLLWMPGPSSFTGEDMAEVHCHGSAAVVEALSRRLSSMPGVRVADPGEFSRRAFRNGKLDLVEVEGLADLIDAETDAQRRQALSSMSGALGERLERFREALVRALAYVEASVDFPEEDLPADLVDAVRPSLETVSRETGELLASSAVGEIVRDGFRVAILGAPNAGKSSLLNRLARRDAAIVSEEEGTTRDVVEVRLDLRDYLVVLSDTAGLRDEGVAGAVEREGMRRSRRAAAAAALRLIVFDGTQPVPASVKEMDTGDERSLWVANKADLGPAVQPGGVDASRVVAVSALSGEGLDALEGALAGRVKLEMERAPDVRLTRERHRAALESVRSHLNVVLEKGQGMPAELIAEELRLAVHDLGRVTGRVDVEDLLDMIFRDFCIGK